MAVTTETSRQLGNAEARPMTRTHASEWDGSYKKFFFDFTQGATAGDAGSVARVVKLPPGRVRVFLADSRIAFSAMGASRTMDLGWEAHAAVDGTTTAADRNGFKDGVDVSSAGAVVPTGTVGSHETVLFESRAGVVLTLQINDGSIPAAATLSGYFALQRA